MFATSRKLRVIVDEREKPSGVPYLLKDLGLMVEYRLLEVGDYLVPGCTIERKEIRDFVRSLYSGRIFDQAYRLRELYDHPILIVEGDVTPLLDKTIKSQVYWGTLSTLIFEYGLNAIFTFNTEQTANLIYTLAKKRKVLRSKGPLIRKKPKMEDLEKMQLIQVSTLPGVGPKLADRMLRRFGTVRKIFTASVAKLTTVGGIGRSKAERIAKVLDAAYRPSEKRPQQLHLVSN